ncbi:zinc-ribbon-domain-containing protein [Mortierella sp. GBAus27b]|nr:zinc-ribbon-domain-containing protein [Mortierella sp. GBAus27b]
MDDISAATTTPTPESNEAEKVDEGMEQGEPGSSLQSRSIDSPSSPGSQSLPRDSSDEDDESDEEMVMQVDPTTGLHRVTSVSRSSRQAQSSSLANRQNRRRTLAFRRGLMARTATSGSSRPRVSTSVTPSTSDTRTLTTTTDEMDEKQLRGKILEIQRDSTINASEKARMIQKLMSSKWSGHQTTSEQTTFQATTEDDLKATFNNEEQRVLGCKHYIRGCKLQANCCGKWFNCRFCHDDACDHAIVRHETKTMLCMHCKAIQPAAQTCASCEVQLARYYCDVCKLWDDDEEKSIYHCPDCGICRVGEGLGKDFFHCQKCNICMAIRLKDKHRCIERNLECDCPICGEYMFTSTETVIFMPCGHSIHSKCHDEHLKTSFQCPTCWKALGDMSEYYQSIDSLLEGETMPSEYAHWRSIVLCNDCEIRSEVPYHFHYHKCDKCKGYNTKVIETSKRASERGVLTGLRNAAGTVLENIIPGDGSTTSPAVFFITTLVISLVGMAILDRVTG